MNKFYLRSTHNLHGQAVLCGKYKHSGSSRKSAQKETKGGHCLLRGIVYTVRQQRVKNTVGNKRKNHSIQWNN